MEKQVVVLSGGSRGLGKELVSHLLSNGYCVATFSRQSTSFIDELQLEKNMKDCFYWEPVDATDFVKIETFCKNVVEKFGRIDTVINNAGVGNDGILTLMSSQSISQIIAINLESAIQLTRIASKYLLRKKGGLIINISSIHSVRGHMGLSVYSATKAALDGFTRSLAKELGPRLIRVNSIAPGYLDTEMTQHFTEDQRKRIIRRTPLGRLGTARDVAMVVDFLLSSGSEFITGQTFVVDGGLTC